MGKSDSSNVLTKEECEKFYREWDNEEVRKEFFNHNIRLTTHVAKKYLGSGIEYDDLSQMAALGLWKAVETFKPEKGFHFATYAIKVMNNEILMQLRKGKGTALVDEKRVVSMDSLLNVDQNGETLTFEDILASDYFEVDDTVMGNELNDIIRTFIENCKPRDAHIVKMYLNGKNQKVIAARVNLSQSYISRIILKFKKNIKSHIRNYWDNNSI